MRIVDLAPEHEEAYFRCLTEEPARMEDSGDYKRRWYEAMKGRGLRVKLALDESGKPIGMVQYAPAEESLVHAPGMYYLYCIWVLNDPKARGNFQGRGAGTALLRAFEEDARGKGMKGVVAWGLSIPAFMQAKWFKKHGYQEAERRGIMVLLWKAWDPDAAKPAWLKDGKRPAKGSGLTCFCNGWCPEVNKAFTRLDRAVQEAGGMPEYRMIDALDPSAFREWRIQDGIFFDGKELGLGPAPSYAKILKAVRKEKKNQEKRGSMK
jgi:GNAT superfamily N-acetyltransferase